MRVRDIIERKKGADVVTIPENADVSMATGILLGHHVGGLVVLEGSGQLKGFLAERDVVRAINRSGETAGRTKVRDVMQRPAPTCTVDDPLDQVMARMNRERLRHLVVTDGGRVVGVLSIGDLVKQRLTELETETGVLRDYVTAQRAQGR